MSKNETTNESRRDFIKKAAYTAPVILTMTAVPTVHAVGSSAAGGNSQGENETPN